MRREKKTKVGTGIITLVVMMLMMPVAVMAGELEPPSGPDNATSAMYTLEDIYNRAATGADGEKRTGGFTEPTSTPVSTGRTIDDIMTKMPVADDTNGLDADDVCEGKTFWGLKTGSWGVQTGTKTTGDCVDRFLDNSDGTVLDRMTGLVWLKNANCFGQLDWSTAMQQVEDLMAGECGLFYPGHPQNQDWRLPTVAEMQHLGTNPLTTWRSDPPYGVVWTNPGPHFVNMQGYYWTLHKTSRFLQEGDHFNIMYGHVEHGLLVYPAYVLPVRRQQQ